LRPDGAKKSEILVARAAGTKNISDTFLKVKRLAWWCTLVIPPTTGSINKRFNVQPILGEKNQTQLQNKQSKKNIDQMEEHLPQSSKFKRQYHQNKNKKLTRPYLKK
jgi:hypothetical protein